MKFLAVFFILSMTCSLATAFITPHDVTNALMPLQRRELTLYSNSRALIEELLQNLRKAANEAMEAIVKFSKGVQEEVADVSSKIVEDIEKLRERVYEAFENVTNKLLDSSVAVTECIVNSGLLSTDGCKTGELVEDEFALDTFYSLQAYRDDANAVFNETFAKTTACIEDRVAEVTDYTNRFSEVVNDAVEYSNQVVKDMKNCSEAGSFVTIGSCLGSIALQTDMKVIAFSAQAALMLARMDLFIGTLPAALQVCAATRLVEAGLHSAKVVMDIGTCSANSVFVIMNSDVSILKGTL